MESPESPLSDQEWMDTAHAKATSIIHAIDHNLEVEVSEVEVTPNHGKPKYDAVVLSFSHRTNSHLRWTMEIEKSFDYIENRLARAIKNAYRAMLNQ
jgi:hypothetical protein